MSTPEHPKKRPEQASGEPLALPPAQGTGQDSLLAHQISRDGLSRIGLTVDDIVATLTQPNKDSRLDDLREICASSNPLAIHVKSLLTEVWAEALTELTGQIARDQITPARVAAVRKASQILLETSTSPLPYIFRMTALDRLFTSVNALTGPIVQRPHIAALKALTCAAHLVMSPANPGSPEATSQTQMLSSFAHFLSAAPHSLLREPQHRSLYPVLGQIVSLLNTQPVRGRAEVYKGCFDTIDPVVRALREESADDTIFFPSPLIIDDFFSEIAGVLYEDLDDRAFRAGSLSLGSNAPAPASHTLTAFSKVVTEMETLEEQLLQALLRLPGSGCDTAWWEKLTFGSSLTHPLSPLFSCGMLLSNRDNLTQHILPLVLGVVKDECMVNHLAILLKNEGSLVEYHGCTVLEVYSKALADLDASPAVRAHVDSLRSNLPDEAIRITPAEILHKSVTQCLERLVADADWGAIVEIGSKGLGADATRDLVEDFVKALRTYRP